jgi:glycine C-acetyltransferase
VLEAAERAIRSYGAGPGAVRFISGTSRPHVELEERLAAFHGREAALLFSSAYAAVMGTLPPLVSPGTLLASDELNHNCIINAARLARPALKAVYRHLAMDELAAALAGPAASCTRAIVVTDGVFSMRGDHAPLDEVGAVCASHAARYPEGVVSVVDDSHGVGALGRSGRGTEELTGGRAGILVATLGKALGVNGGYVAGPATVIDYLRETSPFYVYSNPIGPAEAAAALAALEILDGAEGLALLERLRGLAAHFRRGLAAQGWETLPGGHPIVPLLVRDTARTARLVSHLFARGILVTGIGHPVVPRGEEEIRFQITAAHTPADLDDVLAALAEFRAADPAAG